jgi:hypothetical protein
MAFLVKLRVLSIDLCAIVCKGFCVKVSHTIKNTRIMNFMTPIFESWRKTQITRSVRLHGYLRRQKGNILFVHLWYSANREI